MTVMIVLVGVMIYSRFRALLVWQPIRSIAEFVAAGLRQEGHAVDVAATAWPGLEAAQPHATTPRSST
jgi:hypothetical protein